MHQNSSLHSIESIMEGGFENVAFEVGSKIFAIIRYGNRRTTPNSNWHTVRY